MNPDPNNAPLTPRTLMDVIARVAVVGALIYLCFLVFSPFMGLILWGLILSIMFYPLQQKLARSFGGRQGWASTVMILTGCTLLTVPLVLLCISLVDQVQDLYTKIENGEISLPPPSPKVAEWPVIGEHVHLAWYEAAENSEAFIRDYNEQITQLRQKSFEVTRSAFVSVATFIAALVVAGIFMTWGEPGTHAMQRILNRFTGTENGPALQALSVATLRSVATGVLGVAFIQALLFGTGFILADIPAAGILALIVLLLGIVQLPAVIVAVPVIAYMWTAGDGSTASNAGFTLWFLLAGLSDNILKPMLLGRGVDAPMPVILIGALGGMVAGGFIGLFLGATLLAIGYTVFMWWVDQDWSGGLGARAGEGSEENSG
jgi:predicted PurR-regulated permease PerM